MHHGDQQSEALGEGRKRGMDERGLDGERGEREGWMREGWMLRGEEGTYTVNER